MTTLIWRPPDETAATSTSTAFLEFVRATRRGSCEEPKSLAAWAKRDPTNFAAAIADFAQLDPAMGVRANLLRHTSKREALVRRVGGAREAWSHDQLRRHEPLPATLHAVLHHMDWGRFIGHVAQHLLVADTRPDDRFLWTGAADDAWPYAALAIGTTVVVFDGPADTIKAIALAERATLVLPEVESPTSRRR